MTIETLNIFMPELILAISSVMFTLLGLMHDRWFKNTKAPSIIAGLILLTVFIYVVKYLPDNQHTAFNELFINNQYISIAKCIVLLSAVASILLSSGYARVNPICLRFEFVLLILFSVLGMMVMLSANDFMSMYLGLELQALSLYCLVSFNRIDISGAEGGIKYFILGVLASGIILYGISLIYGFSGTTNFTILNDILHSYGVKDTIPTGMLIGMVLVISGLCFKMSAVPFHTWAPDVYQGAPLPVTAFLATASKATAIFFSLHLFQNTFGAWSGSQQLIEVIAVLSLFIGALGALRQHNLKRLLAYSAIGHVGFILIGVASYSDLGTNAVISYIVIYIVMNIGLFAFIASMQQKHYENFNLDIFKGLAKHHPMTACAIAILVLSMAGMPPLAGFLAKFYILKAAVQSHLYGVAVLGMLSAVISTFYYLKIIKLMYFENTDAQTPYTQNVENFLLSLSATAFNTLLIFFPSITHLM